MVYSKQTGRGILINIHEFLHYLVKTDRVSSEERE